MSTKHTMSELHELQGYPLSIKISLTKQRIREWIDRFGVDGVHVSFSGGKDSTVLLHIAREMYPNMKAAFVDTGLEYPEIRSFVKSFDNVDWLKPKKNFRQVIQDYGYPFISKEVSESAEGAKKYLTALLAESNLDKQTNGTSIAISTTRLRELADTQSLLEMSRGGADNKWRKLRGIGEYSKRADASETGRSQPETCTHVRNADERQGSSDKGEYP